MSDETRIDVDKLSRTPIGLGCATLCLLMAALVLVVVGLFIVWLSSDDAKLRGSDARLPVNRAEHDGAVIGDRIEVWQVDDRYVLDRVVANPTPPVAGYVVLGVGATGIVVAIVLFLVTVRRVKSAAAEV